jgi:ATP-dependent helicase/nuclease subunit A
MLYDVKAAAGPALQPFSFHAAVPRGLPDETADAIKDAYGRFRKYAGWLDRLPPLAAIEKVAGDLALGPWAAAAEGGNERAGAFYKALEVLRAGQAERWSPSQVADALTEIINAEETALWQDALPVRPGAEEASARVMNLHKAKGLEAPVVFLADPSGGGEHEPDIHIDRTGRRTGGRLAVLRRYGSSGIPLAAPPDWGAAGEESRKFGAAEELRLRYVAATRAGALLVVSEKEGGAKAANDPWNDFHAALADAPALPPASESGEAAPGALEVAAADVAKARKEIDRNRKLAAKKSYEKAREKELALKEIPVGTGSGDVTWGRVIHRLLEAAALKPEIVTRALAAYILQEEGADAARAGEAMATVTGVMESPLWRRAQVARRRAAELPYWRKDIGANGVPRVVGGVIDLVFEESDGWVIVDYKTADTKETAEGRPADEAQLRAYARAWREMTAATVKEGGVLYIGAAPRAPVYIPVAI